MKWLAQIIIFVFLISYYSFAQSVDTVYIDEIDTVFVPVQPVVINQIVYNTVTPNKIVNHHTLSTNIGVLYDLNYYYLCNSVINPFYQLDSQSVQKLSKTFEMKYTYLYRKLYFGINFIIRSNKKSIQYESKDVSIQNDLKNKNLIFGPLIGLKILQRNKYHVLLDAGILYSKTYAQKGFTMGGLEMNEFIDIEQVGYYVPHNINYSMNTTVVFYLSKKCLMNFNFKYLFDNNSNVLSEKHNFIEQRNSIGSSFGVSYNF